MTRTLVASVAADLAKSGVSVTDADRAWLADLLEAAANVVASEEPRDPQDETPPVEVVDTEVEDTWAAWVPPWLEGEEDPDG